jgi:AraC-like DNA-binding protein
MLRMTQQALSLTRAPAASQLRAWVERLWLHAGVRPAAAGRELCLPSARQRIVSRLDGAPMRRFFSADDRDGIEQPRLQWCGLRLEPVLRSPADAGLSLGIELRPGASLAFLGVPADRLAGQYLGLDALIPAALRRDFCALRRMPAGAEMLDRVKELLLAWLRRACPPALTICDTDTCLTALAAGTPVLQLAAQSGLSHRAWLAQFRAAVGCTPRAWLGLARFSHALQLLAQVDPPALSEVAATAGFFDQAHLCRSFAAHAGIAPGAYRRSPPRWAEHLLLR